MASIRRDSGVVSAVIANTKQRSGWVDIRRVAVFGFITPSTLDNTTISFEVSIDGSESVDVAAHAALKKSDGSTLSITAAATDTSYDAPVELASWPYFRFVLGGTVAANRTFQVCAKG